VAPPLTELGGGGYHLAGQFMGGARYAHCPGAVADVALEGAEDARVGVAGEWDLPAGVVIIDGLDQGGWLQRDEANGVNGRGVLPGWLAAGVVVWPWPSR
jgi:hypothetical protein